jgi:hypothetical protein
LDCLDKSENRISPRVRDGVFLSKLEKCKKYQIAYYYSEKSKTPLKQSFSTSCDLAYQEINRKVILDDEKETINPIYEYRLEGLVADKATGKPIQNAKVQFSLKNQINELEEDKKTWLSDKIKIEKKFKTALLIMIVMVCLIIMLVIKVGALVV